MSTTTVSCAARHELARRVNGGLEITLFWDGRDNSTSIDIRDASTDETTSFRVPPGRALDAFYHPFAHLGNKPEHIFNPDNIDESPEDLRCTISDT
jgi:hypothetical protein